MNDFIYSSSDDIIFIHHSVGRNWLDHSLHNALLEKSFIEQRNDITYDVVVQNDSGRPKTLGDQPGDRTDMHHWLFWFNDYLDHVKSFNCSGGENRIIMFKSCYPMSDVQYDGSYYGDPFDSLRTLTNYQAVYRNLNGTNATYTYGNRAYYSLEYIFSQNPDTLFIPLTAPPRHSRPNDRTNDTNAHRARVFNEWLKYEWVEEYNRNHPGLNNVQVFDLFDLLAYPDNHTSYPNRLKDEYGGNTGDSHPNDHGNENATAVFAADVNNFIDMAWSLFNATESENQWSSHQNDHLNSGRSDFEYNQTSGADQWTFTTSGSVDISPAISKDGYVYFGTDDGVFYKIDPNGTKIWSLSVGAPIRSSPAISNSGIVYFGADDDRLHAVLPNGTEIWNFTTGGDVRSSPNVGP
ncbi:MAG: PQQ-binding-like beta-propeller repeat protein, partial [Thermoplasmatota archaeon]